jgi:4-hydroxy-L-threonine phosphate dehydrogenase PdxA
MPNPAPVVAYICDAYHLLAQLGPFVAMLIVAGALFLGIFTKHVPMAAVLLAIVIALIIASFPAVLGALGVQIPCQ